MSKKLNQPQLIKSESSSKKKKCCEVLDHPDHSNLLPNINRVAGQIEGIRKMVMERRYCPEILQQIKSAKSALCGIESAMIEAHMDACVTEVFNSKNEKEKIEKIAELKILYRRFND